MNQSDRMKSARIRLILDEPFFGELAMRLELVEDSQLQYAGCTNGKAIKYNPKKVAGLTAAQAVGLMAHEIMHIALGHLWRLNGRNLKKWNIATDKVINTELKNCGFDLPLNLRYAEGEEVGKSADWIYERLLDEPTSGASGAEGADGEGGAEGADGSVSGDPFGEFEEPPGASDGDGIEDWKQAVAQAAQHAQLQGKLPLAMNRLIESALAPKVDWRAVLRRFIGEHAKNDYTWQRPNRRYVAQGLYLPSLNAPECGELAIGVDTSGSMSEAQLRQVRGEIEEIIEDVKPSAVNVYYADAAVARVDRFERGEQLEWRPGGGGGTDFRPAIRAAELSSAVCLVYITDLDGKFPSSPPAIPVIWVTDSPKNAPFGETVRIS